MNIFKLNNCKKEVLQTRANGKLQYYENNFWEVKQNILNTNRKEWKENDAIKGNLVGGHTTERRGSEILLGY